jgi:hypothetical protein
MTPYAKRKAILGAAGFAFFGIVFLFTVNDFLYSLPTLLLYGGLVINTYFSIRCFSSITPKNDTLQGIVDIGLTVLFIALATAFNNIQNFLTIGLFLFELAVVKYTLLLRTAGAGHHAIIRKKVLIDMLGVISGSVGLTLALFGYYVISVWALALLLATANIYLIILKPFYKID